MRNVRDGNATFYYENGHIKKEVTYVNGRVDGVVKEYDEKGILKELYSIENGKRQGPTSYYDDKGVWTGDKDFDKGVRVILRTARVLVRYQGGVERRVDEKGCRKRIENARIGPF